MASKTLNAEIVTAATQRFEIQKISIHARIAELRAAFIQAIPKCAVGRSNKKLLVRLLASCGPGLPCLC